MCTQHGQQKWNDLNIEILFSKFVNDEYEGAELTEYFEYEILAPYNLNAPLKEN